MRIDLGRLGLEVIAVADAVDAARGGVDETRYAGAYRRLGQVDRSDVIDLIGNRRLVLTERIVGELGEVHDRVKALQIALGDLADVFVEARRKSSGLIVVQPAVAVVTGVEPRDVVTARH